MDGIDTKLSVPELLRRHSPIAGAATDAETATMTDSAGHLGEMGASIDRVLARAEVLG